MHVSSKVGSSAVESGCHDFYAPPRSGEEHIVLLLSVRTYVRPSHFVVLFLSPQFLLQYFMQGLETCNTVLTCIEHVYNGNKLLIKVIIAELCPLE